MQLNAVLLADTVETADTPVSYTHLDVYKRQVSMRVLRQGRASFITFKLAE